MTFASEASKLLTNKYFLYFIVFLAVTNVMGYLVTHKINAVVFFTLICILMFNFSKNMAVVLIVAIIATNLLMVNKSMREGFKEGVDGDETVEGDETTTTEAPVKVAAKELQETGTVSDQTKTDLKTSASNKVATKKTDVATKKTDVATKKTEVAAKKTDTTTSSSTDAPVEEAFAPAGAGFSGKKRGAIGGPAKVSRIDYSTTLEQAYDNLDKMLGSDGLSNLSADTEKLMSQQQKLFGAVEKMLPMIDKAQGMIQGLDMSKINSLVGMTEKFTGIGSKLGMGAAKA